MGSIEQKPSNHSVVIEIEDSKVKPVASVEDNKFGAVFSVRVGQSSQVFMIHLQYLEQIPYLYTCYKTHSHGSKADCMEFPSFEPHIFEKIVEYIYFGTVPSLNAIKPPNQEDDQYYGIMLTYLLASKLQMEDFSNKLINVIHHFHGKTVGATVREFKAIESHEAPGGPLKRLLMRSLAEDVTDSGWQAYFKENPEMKKFISEKTSRSMQLAQAICDHPNLPRFEADNNLCQWHSHNRTPRCNHAD